MENKQLQDTIWKFDRIFVILTIMVGFYYIWFSHNNSLFIISTAILCLSTYILIQEHYKFYIIHTLAVIGHNMIIGGVGVK